MRNIALLVLSGLLIGQPLFCHASEPQTQSAQPQSTPLAEGEVRKVDKGAQKITLRHGPIPSLDMPPMTMVYRVKDPAMLDQVKAGDKVRFQVERLDGAFVLVKIEPRK